MPQGDLYKQKPTDEQRTAFGHKERLMVLRLADMAIEERFAEVAFEVAHLDQRDLTNVACVAISLLGATVLGTGTKPQARKALKRHADYLISMHGNPDDE